MAIGGYSIVVIILKVIGGYFIGGYSIVVIILMVIGGYFIGGYYINGYCRLFYWWLLY